MSETHKASNFSDAAKTCLYPDLPSLPAYVDLDSDNDSPQPGAEVPRGYRLRLADREHFFASQHNMIRL